MREIKTWRDPYGEGFSTCSRKVVEFQPGLTVLVGCNGSGKTTLLMNIEEELKKEKVPCAKYNNLSESSDAIGQSLFESDFGMAGTLMCSSEGECITINIGRFAKNLREFIHNGKYFKGKRDFNIESIFKTEEEMKAEIEEKRKHKERWILLDAIDSGLSIDNVLDFKNLFDAVLEEGKSLDLDIYIVVSANEYELVDGSQCLDVTTGKYKTFSDYKEFRKFIIHTREKKDKRYGDKK